MLDVLKVMFYIQSVCFQAMGKKVYCESGKVGAKFGRILLFISDSNRY